MVVDDHDRPTGTVRPASVVAGKCSGGSAIGVPALVTEVPAERAGANALLEVVCQVRRLGRDLLQGSGDRVAHIDAGSLRSGSRLARPSPKAEGGRELLLQRVDLVPGAFGANGVVV